MENIGYVSFLKLSQEDFSNSELKKAFLLYDYCILNVEKELIFDVVSGWEKEEKANLKELKRHLISINQFVSNKKLKDISASASKEKGLLYAAAREASHAYVQKMAPDEPQNKYPFLREVAWTTYGLLREINTFGELKNKQKCSIFTNELEADAFKRIYNHFNKEQQLCEKIISKRVPDFASIPWSEIVNISKKWALKKFKRDLAKLASLVSDSNDVDKIVEAKLSEIYETIMEFEPNIFKNVSLAVLDTIDPTGTIGAITTINDFRDQLRILDKYGCFFFLSQLIKAQPKKKANSQQCIKSAAHQIRGQARKIK